MTALARQSLPTLTEFLLARIGEDEHEAYLRMSGSPAVRAARECFAKRRIVERHRLSPGRGDCWACQDPMPCFTLAALALPYADHPDYQQEWKP